MDDLRHVNDGQKGDVVRSYFKSYSGMNGYDVLDSLESDIKNVAGNTVKLLMAERLRRADTNVYVRLR